MRYLTAQIIFQQMEQFEPAYPGATQPIEAHHVDKELDTLPL